MQPKTELRLSEEVLGGGWDALHDGRCDLVIDAEGARLRRVLTCTRWVRCCSSLPLQPITRWDIDGLARDKSGKGLKWLVSRLKQMRFDTDSGLLLQK